MQFVTMCAVLKWPTFLSIIGWFVSVIVFVYLTSWLEKKKYKATVDRHAAEMAGWLEDLYKYLDARFENLGGSNDIRRL